MASDFQGIIEVVVHFKWIFPDENVKIIHDNFQGKCLLNSNKMVIFFYETGTQMGFEIAIKQTKPK